MKTIITKIGIGLVLGSSLASCSKFDEINTDPTAANIEQVQVEYFINNSIISAQQDPHIAERIFVYHWKSAARQHQMNFFTTGNYSDDYTNDYWRYVSNWLNYVNQAIKVAEDKENNGSAQPYNHNLKQVARIWRAYLMSELSDNFGPVPINGFQGINPDFNSVKDVYYWALTELADAVQSMDMTVPNATDISGYDVAYGYNWEKWVRYGNSMRMRLAMRLSEVDPNKARTEFEDAVKDATFIQAQNDNFTVAEKDGWDGLTGVMSRSWNSQPLSATMNNLMIGLGGVESEDVLGDHLKASIKPAGYIGVKYDQHFSLLTNDPSRGYWLDGLPNKIDPRAYRAFFIPLDVNSSTFFRYGGYENQLRNPKAALTNADSVNYQYTWNAYATGDWGAKGSRNYLRGVFGTNPALANDFRNSRNSRIFFASWESYFLIAEAALRGWSTPMSAEQAYEQGIKESFAYWGLTSYVDEYIESQEYNRVGSSVKFSHTAEPGTGFTVRYIDGYSKREGTATIAYPSNTLYKNGTVRNDQLTKIITQKYIAQFPWLPLEAWNDHRRLGLPFFENPAIENPLPNMPALNSGNYLTNSVNFFPQRQRYPSSLRTSDPEGYEQAVSFLGGGDDVFTPLWWAIQK